MQIHGSTKSKAFKVSDKKIAKALGLEGGPDLRDMVGKLELNATRSTDFALLRELHWVFIGGEWGGGGSVTIVNAKGQKFVYKNPTKKQLARKETKKNGTQASSKSISLASQ